jgi:hypothetical protein
VGSPSGGPRDQDPPQVVESEPPNYSTRFEARKIQVTFDEYIVLENVNQELVVSPPMETKPDVKLKKKTLVIQFEEELKENTTYTFNFGNAIKDLHEGNKLQNFEYVFSTGDVLDSMSVKGTLRYAETLEKPKEAVSIMLYDDLRDSVPLREIPLYVGRSNDSGIFSVNNLQPGTYKVFALKDGNNNFLYDMPSEEIAFLDSSLNVTTDFVRTMLGIESPDSSGLPVNDLQEAEPPLSDSTITATDTIPEPGPDLSSIYVDLMLFTEASELQYITDYSRDDRRKLQMAFALPVTDSFEYEFIQDREEEVRFLEDFSVRRDSLSIWVIDSLQYKKDSLWLALTYTVLDTAHRYVSVKDTLVFTYRERTSSRRERRQTETEEVLNVSTIRNRGYQDLHNKLALSTDFPLERLTDTLFSLYHIPDSVEVPVPVRLDKDSVMLNRALLSAEWEPAARYRLRVLPGALVSIYPLEHDTIDVSFETRDSEYYGRILLNLSQVKHRVLVQLISSRKVISVLEADSDGEYIFPNLRPEKYTIKFIHDINRNGRWDTGKYLEKRQPEPVELLPGDIEVRSNWDHDVSVTLQK